MRTGHPDNPQCTERFLWSVLYADGTLVEEYPEPTTHLSFTQVDIERVVRLHVMPNHWLSLCGQAYTVLCDPSAGVRPIMFRANAIHMLTGQQLRYHVFGTQQTIGKQNVKSLIYLADDEHEGTPVILTDRPLQIG